MSIQVGTHARIGVKQGAAFQYIREVEALGEDDYSQQATVRNKLCSVRLQCQKGMTPRSAVQCLQCPRLVNFVPNDNSVLIRCLWTDTDQVEAMMTLESELVTISPSASLADAEALAKSHNLDHLLVVEEERLIGIVSRGDLGYEEFGINTISDRVNLCPWTIGPTTTLAQAAQLMEDRQIRILPVVANRNVLGVVTRGDLRRAGVVDSILESRLCG